MQLHRVAYSCITDVLMTGSSCSLQKAVQRAALWNIGTGMLGSDLRQRMPCFLANALQVISFAVLLAHVSSQQCSPVR